MAKAGVSDVLKAFQKQHGLMKAKSGADIKSGGFMPTGIFAMDYQLGGGIPEGCVNMIYGAESSAKTTLSLKIMANYLNRNKHKKGVWIDAEFSFDASWAKKIGMPMDRLTVVRPDYGEQIIDLSEGLMEAEDLGFMVVDSLASLVPKAELEGDGERAQVGGNSVLVGRLCAKVLIGLNRASEQNNFPTVIFINQIRFKIGMLFGNPEIYPGGQRLKHTCRMVIHLYATDEIEKSINPDIPTFKKVKVTLKKYKNSILSKSFDIRMALVPIGQFPVAHVAEGNMVIDLSKDLGIIAKQGSKWTFNNLVYPTLTSITEYLRDNKEVYEDLKTAILKTAKSLDSEVEDDEADLATLMGNGDDEDDEDDQIGNFGGL